MDSVYSINIERAVLSSILFNPEELEDVLGVLKPKDFIFTRTSKNICSYGKNFMMIQCQLMKSLLEKE